MFKLLSLSDTRPETSSPFVDYLIENGLLQARPDLDQVLLQLIHIFHRLLVYMLLYTAPNAVSGSRSRNFSLSSAVVKYWYVSIVIIAVLNTKLLFSQTITAGFCHSIQYLTVSYFTPLAAYRYRWTLQRHLTVCIIQQPSSIRARCMTYSIFSPRAPVSLHLRPADVSKDVQQH